LLVEARKGVKRCKKARKGKKRLAPT